MNDEPVMAYLQRCLKQAGPRQFAQIAKATGTTPTLLPKLAYGMRDNPRILSIQPLLDYFRQVERVAGGQVTKNVTPKSVKRRPKKDCRAGRG